MEFLYTLGAGQIAAVSVIVFIGASSLANIILGFKSSSSTQLIDRAEEAAELEVAVTERSSDRPQQDDWSDRLKKGLEVSRLNIWEKIAGVLKQDKLDQDELDEIEETLYGADIAPSLVQRLLSDIEQEYRQSDKSQWDFKTWIKGYFNEILGPVQNKNRKEFWANEVSGLKVVMVVGVNGAGKTTTIGKLATRLSKNGAKVVVGACDTFRAAAVEQLEVWADRAGCKIVKGPEGGDPSGVAYDAVAKAKKENADYCIIDTAGRLHTMGHLMDELAKTKRVIQKLDQNAPHETLLVLDAVTGQNAMRQAEEFNKSLEISGLVFTKCDGSAKAGSAISIVDQLKTPIAWIGVGEQVEDLNLFQVEDYLEALIS
jgi:fused signal recognition particle receptor